MWTASAQHCQHTSASECVSMFSWTYLRPNVLSIDVCTIGAWQICSAPVERCGLRDLSGIEIQMSLRQCGGVCTLKRGSKEGRVPSMCVLDDGFHCTVWQNLCIIIDAFFGMHCVSLLWFKPAVHCKCFFLFLLPLLCLQRKWCLIPPCWKKEEDVTKMRQTGAALAVAKAYHLPL